MPSTFAPRIGKLSQVMEAIMVSAHTSDNVVYILEYLSIVNTSQEKDVSDMMTTITRVRRSFPKACLLIMANDGYDAINARAILAGADCHIPKLYKFETIAQIIKDAFN